MARKDKFSESQLENIAKCQAKKTARRKKKKRSIKAKNKSQVTTTTA